MIAQGNDPVETVVITANIIDTVHMPANKRNASALTLSHRFLITHFQFRLLALALLSG